MKFIIDTDAGGDDAVALLLGLSTKLLQIIAITCTYGNTDEANVEVNVLKTLTIANRSDIPVYAGATKPLVQEYTTDNYFGQDGFGDFKFDKKILGTVDRSKHASIAMIELAKKHSGDISILTLGPLTNVALAASLDPNFIDDVNRFYVMGGSFNESGLDSKCPTVEFNFRLDTESDEIFLNLRTKLKTLVTPIDVVFKYNISKIWRTEVLGKLNSEKISFLNKVENKTSSKRDIWLPSDALALAVILWPDLITYSKEACITTITYGQFKGAVKIETDNLICEEKNVEVIRRFNVTAFQNKLLKYLA